MSEKSDLDLASQNEMFHLEIHQDEQSHRVPLTNKIFIGSGNDADLKIGEANLLPKHILIQLKNELPSLKIAAANGLITLNQSVLNPNQDYLLNIDDQINISNITIIIKKSKEKNDEIKPVKSNLTQRIATRLTMLASLLKIRKSGESNSGLQLESNQKKKNKESKQININQLQNPKVAKNNRLFLEPANTFVRLQALILDIAMAYAFAVTFLPLLSLQELWPTLSRELIKGIHLPKDFFIDANLIQDIFPSYLLFYTTRLFFILVFKRSFGQLMTGIKLDESGIIDRIKSLGVWLVDFLFSWTIIANFPAFDKKPTIKERLLSTQLVSPPKYWGYVNIFLVPVLTLVLFFSPLALTTNIISSPLPDISIKAAAFENSNEGNTDYIFMAQSGLLKWIGPGAYFKNLIEKKYLILPTIKGSNLEIHIFDKINNNHVVYSPETSLHNGSISWPLILEDIFLNNFTPFLTCSEFPTQIKIEYPLNYNPNMKKCLKNIFISALKVSTDRFTDINFWTDTIFMHGPFPTTLTAMQRYLTLKLPKKFGIDGVSRWRFLNIQNTEYLEIKGSTQTILLSLDEAGPRPLRFETKQDLDQIYKDIFAQVQQKQSEANLMNPTPTINLFAPLDEMFALVTKKIKILEGDRAQNLLQFFSWQQDHLDGLPTAKEIYKKSLEDFMALQEGQILSKSLQELLNKLEQPALIPSNEETVHE